MVPTLINLFEGIQTNKQIKLIIIFSSFAETAKQRKGDRNQAMEDIRRNMAKMFETLPILLRAQTTTGTLVEHLKVKEILLKILNSGTKV